MDFQSFRTAIPGALVLLLATGCATTGALRQEPLNAGVERRFDAPLSTVLNAARESVVEAGISIESAEAVDDDTWVIVGQKDASAWSWGELVRVVVTSESGSEPTIVRVVTQRRLSTNVAADDDHSTSIFGGIALRLASES